MDKVTLSIIVPVHNMEAHLESCLDSLLRQTLPSMEFICVDDGSVDKSPEILLRFQQADPRVMVLRNEGSKGAGKARNIGMAVASGTYIGFVDADDVVAPEMFERLYRATVRNETDIAACFPRCFDDRTNVSVPVYYFEQAMQKLGSTPAESMYSAAELITLLPYIPVVPWNKIYRTGFLRDCKACFAEGMMHEDFLFYFQAMLHASGMTLIREKWYGYRVNRNNSLSTSRGQAVFRDIPRIFRLIENSLQEYLKRPEIALQYDLFRILHLIAWGNQLFRSNRSREEQQSFFGLLVREIQSLSMPPSLDFIDKVQYLLIKKNQPFLFRLKVRMDQRGI